MQFCPCSPLNSDGLADQFLLFQSGKDGEASLMAVGVFGSCDKAWASNSNVRSKTGKGCQKNGGSNYCSLANYHGAVLRPFLVGDTVFDSRKKPGFDKHEGQVLSKYGIELSSEKPGFGSSLDTYSREC